MKKVVLLSPVLFAFSICFGQSADTMVKIDSIERLVELAPEPVAPQNSGEVYKLKPAVDVPLTAVTMGWSLYAFTKIYSKDPSTPAQIQALNKNDLAPINRAGADNYSLKAQNISDYLFYGSMPLPIVLLLDKKIRKDAGKIGFLFLETMSVTGVLYTSSVYFKDKYRPYAYNPNVPLDERIAGGAKNSFFAGHPALVGTSTFFMAKVYADYHPESKIKWLMYTAASLATVTTGYLRYKGGMHHLTDVFIGTAIGPLIGILVPHFHKVKNGKEPSVSLMPYYGNEKGIAMVWKF